MPLRPPSLLILLGCILLSVPTLSSAQPTPPSPPSPSSSAPPPPATAWDQASQFLFNEAYQSFKTLPASARPERFGSAVVLLNVQPRTSGNLTTAREALEKLLAENPSDETGINARYFLGRIASLHQNTADTATARRHFETLVADHPTHPLAQQAVIKLALMDFYPANGTPPAASLYTAYSARAAQLSDASARRDLHLLLARTALFYQTSAPSLAAPEFSLTHYQAALDTGALSFRVRGETLVAIGELARSLGRTTIAADAYRAFLKTYSRDIRAGTITERLAALDTASSSAVTP